MKCERKTGQEKRPTVECERKTAICTASRAGFVSRRGRRGLCLGAYDTRVGVRYEDVGRGHGARALLLGVGWMDDEAGRVRAPSRFAWPYLIAAWAAGAWPPALLAAAHRLLSPLHRP
jgi:hypothetical protein